MIVVVHMLKISSIQKSHTLELKHLPNNLKYAYLEGNKLFVIAFDVD